MQQRKQQRLEKLAEAQARRARAMERFARARARLLQAQERFQSASEPAPPDRPAPGSSSQEPAHLEGNESGETSEKQDADATDATARLPVVREQPLREHQPGGPEMERRKKE